MPTKIFVGRLVEGISSDEIRTLFRRFGAVTECDVIANYAFVHMESEDEAKAAIAALDGQSVHGTRITVEFPLCAVVYQLSTTNTQGRKRKFENAGSSLRGGSRGGPPPRHFAPYPPRHEMELERRPPAPAPPQQREEFASEQVKDLLELYIRDPTAFDQYARSYYYGERAERQLAAAAAASHNGRMMHDR